MLIIVIRYQCIYRGTQEPVEIHTWQATKSWSRYTTCVKIFQNNNSCIKGMPRPNNNQLLTYYVSITYIIEYLETYLQNNAKFLTNGHC